MAPTVYDVRHARAVKQSARAAADRAEEFWMDELEQRVGSLGLRIKAPAAKQRRAERFGGGYRSAQKGSYDWFYDLNPKEQARIRSNWMSSDPGAPTPDEIEERIPLSQWVQTTRAVDMAKAVKTGRRVERARYGGLRPEALIAGEPYDLAELHHDDEHRAAAHVRRARADGRTGRHHVPKNPHNVARGIAYKADGSLDVQFFTDERGQVHPIRASYETMTPAERRRMKATEADERRRKETGKVRYYNRAFGTYEEHDYAGTDDEEAF